MVLEYGEYALGSLYTTASQLFHSLHMWEGKLDPGHSRPGDERGTTSVFYSQNQRRRLLTEILHDLNGSWSQDDNHDGRKDKQSHRDDHFDWSLVR